MPSPVPPCCALWRASVRAASPLCSPPRPSSFPTSPERTRSRPRTTRTPLPGTRCLCPRHCPRQSRRCHAAGDHCVGQQRAASPGGAAGRCGCAAVPRLPHSADRRFLRVRVGLSRPGGPALRGQPLLRRAQARVPACVHHQRGPARWDGVPPRAGAGAALPLRAHLLLRAARGQRRRQRRPPLVGGAAGAEAGTTRPSWHAARRRASCTAPSCPPRPTPAAVRAARGRASSAETRGGSPAHDGARLHGQLDEQNRLHLTHARPPAIRLSADHTEV